MLFFGGVMEKVYVIIVILVLVFVIYFLATGKRGKNENAPEEKKERNTEKAAAPQAEKPKWEDIGTRLVSKLSIEQLDNRGMVVKTFDVNEIPPEGVTVSRPGAKLGDVILSEAAGEDAMTVGTEAIVLGEDEKGMFGKIYDNGREKNKLFLYDPVVNKSREVTQFDIANNTMICIGRQWLRFVVPTVPGAPVPINNMAVDPAILRSTPAPSASPSAVAPEAPSGFSFESSVDEKGRFVITRSK